MANCASRFARSPSAAGCGAIFVLSAALLACDGTDGVDRAFDEWPGTSADAGTVNGSAFTQASVASDAGRPTGTGTLADASASRSDASSSAVPMGSGTTRDASATGSYDAASNDVGSSDAGTISTETDEPSGDDAGSNDAGTNDAGAGAGEDAGNAAGDAGTPVTVDSGVTPPPPRGEDDD